MAAASRYLVICLLRLLRAGVPSVHTHLVLGDREEGTEKWLCVCVYVCVKKIKKVEDLEKG